MVLARTVSLMALGLGVWVANPVLGAALELVETIPLPNVDGRIDHMAVDVASERLFVAALGNNTVEVIDLKRRSRVRSMQGFGEPQGLAYVTQSNRLFVANGGAGRVDIFDATSLAPIRRIDGLADADNVRYDAKAQQIYVGYGKGALRILDAATGDASGELKISGHPESFQLEEGSERIFVNIPTAGHIAVLDGVQRKVVGTWELHGAAANFPMALDEAGRRLFVGVRKPAELLVYDTDSGKLVARLSIGGDTDDVFFDAARKRIYAICGQGLISVVQQGEADRYTVLEAVRTASGARTGLFVAPLQRLYVAAPARGGSDAEVRAYAVR
jgi:DNA-binding beta-propeller fold protein YncE